MVYNGSNLSITTSGAIEKEDERKSDSYWMHDPLTRERYKIV
jgi:hypothetical protein